MVTSSAVVGSSAISMRGLQDERDGDHDALAHAAGELMRIAARGTAIRIGDAELGQQVAAPRGGRACVDAAMLPQRLDDLRADRVDRIERRHRLLEDHRDVVAAHLPQLSIVKRSMSLRAAGLAGEPDRAATPWCRVGEPPAP